MPLTLWIIIFSLIGGVFSLIGGVLLLVKEEWVKRQTMVVVSWAAGVLLSVSFLDLFPEAVDAAENLGLNAASIFVWPFLAMVGFFFFERSLMWWHHHHEPHAAAPTNVMLLAGDSLHNFIDGVVITTAFLISIPTGVVTAVAVAAHEIPQEMADFGLFLKSGMKRGQVFVVNFVAAMMTLVGAVAAMWLSSVVEQFQPQLLAFTAGMFTYIAASDLIPELHHEKSRSVAVKQTVAFLAGVGVTFGLRSLLGV